MVEADVEIVPPSRIQRWFTRNWGLLTLVPVVVAWGLVDRYLTSDPFLDNVFFTMTGAIVGWWLTRQQGRLQEALGDLELTEKSAAIYGAVKDLDADPSVNTVLRILYDGRAGLSLVPLGNIVTRVRFLQVLNRLVDRSARKVGNNLGPYAFWNDDDWARYKAAAVALRSASGGRRAYDPQTRHELTKLSSRLDDLLSYEQTRDRVSFPIFKAHFTSKRNRIRVLLRWDLLENLVSRGEATITMRRWDSAQTVAWDLLFAPWYRDASGAEANYDSERGKPYTYAEIAQELRDLPPSRRETIEAIRDDFLDMPEGSAYLCIPTYGVGGGRRIVLDGNHRLAAMAILDEPSEVSVVEFQIDGPLDHLVVADLTYWTRIAMVVGESTRD